MKEYGHRCNYLPVTAVVITCTFILYYSLYHGMTIPHNQALSTPGRFQNEVDHSHYHIAARLMDVKQNLTQISGKVGELLNLIIRSGLNASKDAEIAENSRKNSKITTPKTETLLTLFTTLNWNKECEGLFNNTMMNWVSFKPLVTPVLFTTDRTSATLAKSFGWEVLNVSKSASNGLPVLKSMYIDVMKKFRSHFYCYSNSDILFDGGLLKTLVYIQYFAAALPYKHLLVTGKRYNVVNVTSADAQKRTNLKPLVSQRGELFITSAQDYFITDRFYPWESIPEVVVGSLAYDNWLVLNAREKRHLVVDATQTITAVHQSFDSNNHRSHEKEFAQYNGNLLKRISRRVDIPYHKGFFECIERFTDIVSDVFVLRDRTVNTHCN